MKPKNWAGVEESTPFEKLPAGGYVIRIVGVEDVPAKEYLNIVYDVAEGEHAGFYSDDFGKRNPWAHRFVRSYKETAEGMFKAFLMRLEESNRNFSIANWQVHSDERAFIGLELGIVLQLEQYTNDKGEDKERLEVVGVYASQDIRNGDFKLPPVKDSRKGVPGNDGAADPYANTDPYAGAGQDEQPPLSAYEDLFR